MLTEDIRDAQRALLDAARLTTSVPNRPTEPGEWGVAEMLGHVALLEGALLATVATVAAGSTATFDTRVSHNPWTIGNVAVLTGDVEATVERIARLGELLARSVELLTDAELGHTVGVILATSDQHHASTALALRELVAGFVANEIPGHTSQLLGLLAGDAHRR